MPKLEHPLPFIKERGAGVLLHITSLPSPWSIGDIGPEARKFASFLQQSNQKYWQLLPLNPTSTGAGYSPYSSTSSMAANTTLISVEDLADEGLLSKNDLRKYIKPSTDKVNFNNAEHLKSVLLKKAYDNFVTRRASTTAFEHYCDQEAHWLTDYTLFTLLKAQFHQRPWIEWPAPYRKRDQRKLNDFQSKNSEAFRFAQWKQFVFAKQWKVLRDHCQSLNIKLFGDLPFYVSHDSVDVWTHPEIFNLDSRGRMAYAAGVPPDYFNNDGQHWGMPVYRWEVLKKDNYNWWMQRLQQNMKYFDLLRLDHFRAFADYWEIPAREKTARHGKWTQGPGVHFFNIAKNIFKSLPFVAEDLGDINEQVYALRDAFKLPGMVVLQFAFGDNMATSDYIPHRHIANSIAYTGTHDNNTTVGWYTKDIDHATRKRIAEYLQQPVKKSNVHDVLGRMAYASVANTVILPLQDVLGLNEKSRMNKPASPGNHWSWRVKPGLLNRSISKKLSTWVATYGR